MSWTYEFRRSRTLSGARLEEVWDLFDRRLRAILPFIRQQLKIWWVPLGRIERQLTAHGSGGFFAPHVDTGDAAVAKRRISCIYYFHASPRRFTGGRAEVVRHLGHADRQHGRRDVYDAPPARQQPRVLPERRVP